MKLIFETRSASMGRNLFGACGVESYELPKALLRNEPPDLPCVSENDLSRHYTALAGRTHGVNNGFYPLGSCTMKYNPKVHEEIAALPGFTGIHPLQSPETAAGCRRVLEMAERFLCELTGMDRMSFQPAAGAQGEFTGLLLIRAYHRARGDAARTKMLVPDSAHGTNPASAAMAGFTVAGIASRPDGCVDLQALRQAVGPDTAGLMLTNPNTAGLFERDIAAITEIVHAAGGLVYYDGANLNAIMGVARPGDMGFDVMHLNLHKTFSTPHGGGGPGSGPVGCKAFLQQYLPGCASGERVPAESIGQVRSFYGNFPVVVRALCYILTLGGKGLREAAENAVLNANYLMTRLAPVIPMAYPGRCMHEFVMTLEKMKKETGVSALDIAKSLLDFGIHPPTMYFPLIVHEALMAEPTETESRETMDEFAEVMLALYRSAYTQPEALHEAPLHTPVRRVDEVTAARNPIVRYKRNI